MAGGLHQRVAQPAVLRRSHITLGTSPPAQELRTVARPDQLTQPIALQPRHATGCSVALSPSTAESA